MTWYARSYSRSVVPYAITFQQDVTLSEHLQMASDKKVKFGTTGAAIGHVVTGQTVEQFIVDLPTGNILRVRDKDRTGDLGAAPLAGAPAIMLSADNATQSSYYSYWYMPSTNAQIGVASADMYVFAAGSVNLSTGSAGNVNITPGSTGKAVFARPIQLKGYTTAGRPTFANGDLAFDTDLDKAIVGGAAAWEAITSV